MTRRRTWAALLAGLLLVLGLPAAAAGGDGPAAPAAEQQVLTWTAGDDITRYTSAPGTAVAGPATIVFENSEATGNTTGMPHTLTFTTADPAYNSDVQLNVLANPFDAQGGRHTAEVTLSPGRYLYHCTIPGHGEMKGVLVVTEGDGGDDTTAPETAAEVAGTRNGQGQYVGSASVSVTATDTGGSGVDRVEYALGTDGAWQPYTTPVVIDEVGDHTVRYRAFDKAGNAAAEKSVAFTVAPAPTDDTDPPETSATVDGERNADGAYLDMATVTVSASDTGSGVNGVEYAVGDGVWQPYTQPVMVHQVGTHTVRYRATDKAGNVAPEKSVAFTVAAAPPRDTTAPVTGATVEGARNANGAYVGGAKVTVSATDAGGSGVAGIEYALDGGPYLAYAAPVLVDRAGSHTVAYRASDRAGNVSAALSVGFTVVAGGGVPAPPCPEYDERLTVIVGTVDTGVPNRVTDNRCRINELIEDEREWTSHALFLKHVREVTARLRTEGVIDRRELEAVRAAARESGIGTPGRTEGYRTIMDGTAGSLARWEQVGGGSFTANGDGSITSGTTTPGMGMLWFPERAYGDFSLKLQWRDDAPGTGNANSGVLVRFPWVHGHPEEPRPEWVAVKYGHEIQEFDGPAGDLYKTGSVYGFDRVGLAGAGVTQKGTWNDYEIRVVDQHYSVYRNGVLINEFDNTGGQEFSPPRADDPGTDGRRYAAGYIGLQVHGTTDVVSYRDVRIMDL
ncbi:OmpL47-type beta-barrel domain-containing protein [Streptomyces griseoviridis]|uniref:Plastocyanin n=1 Tax=Streptomyces griseoviridis TaxID=45398 RepID=A0ABT9LPF2_STRGD|nr:family 16 glycoside hydrolase [Streptomyces griseoviridis]MDP9685416.1 plastocyanin [Streptomyces griseoviridis]GGS87235.1 glycosyl hydrolase [Streptomyces griseoviridis]